MGNRERRKRKKANQSEAVKAVEDALVKRSRDDAVTLKKDTELFVIDDGSRAPKDRRTKKQDLMLARKLRASDKALRQKKNQQLALRTAVSLQRKQQERQRKKASTTTTTTQVQRTSSLQKKNPHQIQRISPAATKPSEGGLFDLWGSDGGIKDPLTRDSLQKQQEPKGNKTNEWVKGVLDTKGVDRAWRRTRQSNIVSSPETSKQAPNRERRAENGAKNGYNKFNVKGAGVISAGTSYNPDEVQRQALVKHIAEEELTAQQILRGRERAELEREALEDDVKQIKNKKELLQITDGTGSELVSAEEAPGASADDGSDSDSDSDGDGKAEEEDETQDWLRTKNEHHVNKDKLTKTQRNKAARHARLMNEHAKKKAEKKFEHQLRRSKILAKEVQEAEKLLEQRRVEAKERLEAFHADPRNAQIKIGGKVRPVLDSVPVLLKDEVAEDGASVRAVPNKTNAIKDRMNVMLRRNQVELGDRRRRRRRGLKNKYDKRDNGGVTLLIEERRRQREQGLIR